ncbi:hypothetical protein [Pseudomonas panipatensis]|uniref:Uncharacterized protein n=1 Tax=Pseudomonas panipatensis TaxID=428992 RepID=A0A1G8DLC0_9PSED|nr:hypothetical protein [Pseudomonas panipatensis]SDH58269.1 hypothetical protein SAMN05216272_10222 [Pseudomonas panipatensis]SMP41077.1 hypothetical protein SAMN06295951_101469 [Pseudomonas panipatensis]
MSGSNKGFCLGATQPEIPPPAPAPTRRYSLRAYQLGQRRRCVPTTLLSGPPRQGN